MKDLRFIQLEKENETHYRLFEELMISYNKELDGHKNRKMPVDFILKIARSIMDMQGPCDRHLEFCYDGDNLIGFLYGKVDHKEHKGFIKPGYGYIMEFYVKPEYRKKGYGRAMFERLEDHFASFGTKKMYLTADPVTGNPFWEAMGFVNTKVRSPENGQDIYEKAVRNLKYSVLEADENDAAFITMLYHKNITPLHGDKVSFEAFKNMLREAKSGTDERNFLVYEGGVPGAWLKINGLDNANIAWISMLAVDSGYQRKGIGTYAIGFAEDYICSKGKNKVRIQTSEDNIPARNLYKKCGYTVTGTKKGVYADGSSMPAYIFEKTVSLKAPSAATVL